MLEFCKLAYTEFYKPGYIALYTGTVARTFLNITVYPRHGVIEPMRIRIYLKKLKPNEKVELIPPIKFSGKLEKI